MKSKIILTSVIVTVLSLFSLVQYLSVEPEIKEIDDIVKQYEVKNPNEFTGEATTSSLLFAIDTLLHKNWGYTSNDILVKVNLYDNMPNWELGVWTQTKDLALAYKNEITRSQSTSVENPLMTEAFEKINYQNDVWLYFIRTEGRYKDSHTAFDKYLRSLSDLGTDTSQFYSRADNLNFWLGLVENSLGSYSQRLSASAGQKERVNTNLAGDKNAKSSTIEKSKVRVKTPWLEIDDVFWESRGATWALLHYMKAVRIDFYDVLEDKNALVSLDQIIRELEASQEPVYFPMILNGSGFGVLANHSLAMANYISRAKAAIGELRNLLEKG